MQNVIIVGASGFGREVLATINTINKASSTWNVIGFLDDNLCALDGFDLDLKILGTIRDWEVKGDEQYVLAIAAPGTKEKIVSGLKAKGARFASIIDPSVTIGDRTRIGEGFVAFAQADISVDCRIGDFVFLNSLAAIGHDAVIGDYCTFGPKVCISGATNMGKCVNVGALASTYPGVEVGEYSTIGMNSAVIKRVKPETTVIGVPAKAL